MTTYTRLFDIIYYQQQNYAQPDAFAAKENGTWKQYSTDDIINTGNKVSLGLLKLGLKADDKIAIIANNRPEWNIVDLGILQIGAVVVPIYPTISEGEYNFIFNDAEIKAVFVSDQNLFAKISNIKVNTPSLQHIYSFNKVDGCKHFDELLALAEGGDRKALEETKNSIQSNALATIIYTSGTTGTPKGVMLSHDNVVSNIKAVNPILPVNSESRTLSFLPLCHIFERMVVYVYMSVGVSVWYAESIDTVGADLKEVKPNLFTSVPRLLEKVYIRIQAAGADLTGFKKKLYAMALEFAANYELDKDYGIVGGLKYKLLDKLIYSKWREALGGNCSGICIGAAALNPKLAHIFTCAGIMICEGYGQTETSPVICVNPFELKRLKFGSVGPVIQGVEVKLDETTGEILCKGPNVMMGYYKRPDLTAEVLKDGWLKTGDVGVFIDYNGEKYLRITDRIKELFKTSGGKYIAPQSIENKMKEIGFIEQIMVVGEGKNFVSALIVPNFGALAEWCKTNEVNATSHEDIAKSPEVKKMLQTEIDRINKNFGHWETVKKFVLLTNEWSVESGELTPTMKAKRKVILEKYKDVIESMYA